MAKATVKSKTTQPVVRRQRDVYHDVRSVVEGFGRLRAEYDIAKPSRFRRTMRGVNLQGTGADYHYRSEAQFLRVMEWARDVERNDMVVGQGIGRVVCSVLGPDGFKVDPRTGSDELNAALKQRFNDWAADPRQCDVSQEHTFAKLCELAFRSQIRDGDYLLAGRRSGELQSFEAHRMRTPRNTTRNVVHGVLMDGFRRRLAYWTTKDEIDPNKIVSRVADMNQLSARDAEGFRQVFHIYNPQRVSATRGISSLAPVGDPIGFHNDIQFAKLVQQQVASAFAILHNYDPEFSRKSDAQTGEQSTETLGDGSTRTIEGMSPGMHYFGEEGETLTGFSPRIPNPEWFDHTKLILTIIALNLGLPLVVFLMDASQTNFSGYRGALSQAREGFRRAQRGLIARLHGPVYIWKVRQFLFEDEQLRKLAGAVVEDGRLMFTDPAIQPLGHHWQPHRWDYIEPNKDAQGDVTQLKNHLSSPRRIAAQRGMEWDDLSEEIVSDRDLLWQRAKAVAGGGLDDKAHMYFLLTGELPKGAANAPRPPREPAQAAASGNGRMAAL